MIQSDLISSQPFTHTEMKCDPWCMMINMLASSHQLLSKSGSLTFWHVQSLYLGLLHIKVDPKHQTRQSNESTASFLGNLLDGLPHLLQGVRWVVGGGW